MPIPTATHHAPRKLLRDQVYDRLLEAIVSGALAPSSVLVDKELEGWLGASRTPIREAIMRLSNAGFVEVIPQKETRVAAIDVRDFAWIVETLGAIHTAVVREAVPLLTPDDHVTLGELRDRIEAGELAGPSADRTEAVTRVFTVFLDRYDNRVIRRLPDRYLPHLQRVLNVQGDRIDIPTGIAQIRTIVAGAVDGDAEGAAAACDAYFTELMLPFAVRLAETIQAGDDA